MRGKREGSVLDMLSVCICILALAVVATAYFYCSDLLLRKGQISQVSRRYILKMESVGCLTETDKNRMLEELQAIGLQSVDLTGSTMEPVQYGSDVILRIRGNLRGRIWGEEHDLFRSVFTVREVPADETLLSTAKH